MDQSISPLSEQELESLNRAEHTIGLGMRSFIAVGMAMAAIRDAKLYRSTHTTFAAYLKDRWGISRAQGYRTINSAQLVRKIEPMAHDRALPIPTSERQVRLLLGVKDPEVCLSILAKAKEIADNAPLVTKHISQAMRKLQIEPECENENGEADLKASPFANGGEMAQIIETVIGCLEHRTHCEREVCLLKRLKELMACTPKTERRQRGGNGRDPEIHINGANTDYVIRV